MSKDTSENQKYRKTAINRNNTVTFKEEIKGSLIIQVKRILHFTSWGIGVFILNFFIWLSEKLFLGGKLTLLIKTLSDIFYNKINEVKIC